METQNQSNSNENSNITEELKVTGKLTDLLPEEGSGVDDAVAKAYSKTPLKAPEQKRAWTIDELIEYHVNVVNQVDSIRIDDESNNCFNYIVNTTGSPLLIPNLMALDINPDSQNQIQLESGKIYNLPAMFPAKAINRHRGMLLNAMNNSAGQHGFPQILNVDKDVIFPEDVMVEVDKKDSQRMPVKDKEGKVVKIKVPFGSKTLYEVMRDKRMLGLIELPPNEFDDKIAELVRKEEEAKKKEQEGIGKYVGDRITKEEFAKRLKS